MATTMLRLDQLEYLWANVERRHKELFAAYRNSWRSDEDRAAACKALVHSVNEAKGAIERCREMNLAELQPLVNKLVISCERADGSIRNPSTLRR